MKPFNLYDLLGILAPGTIVVIGLVSLFPNQAVFLSNKELSIGGLGVLAILSYVIGGLLGGIGNVIESIYYKFRGGNPTEKLRFPRKGGIPMRELEQLEARLVAEKLIEDRENIADMLAPHWHGVTRQIHSFLDNRGRTGRLDIFNSQYGMYRGIVAALLVLGLGAILAKGLTAVLPLIAIFGVCILVALQRMNRFGQYYATELVRQFIQCPQQFSTSSSNNTLNESN